MSQGQARMLGALVLVGLAFLLWMSVSGIKPGRLGQPGQMDPQQLVGSSYENGPRGTSDLFRMLSRTHERVERWIRPITQLPPGGTLVVISPATSLHLEEQRQLLLHAEAGGTVVLVSDWIPELLEIRGLTLRQVPLPASSRPQVPSTLVDPDAPLESRGMALLEPTPAVLSLYGSSHGARVGLVATGQGRMVVVTDPFVLSNDGIRRDGNLRFAWRLAHALPEPIRFDEHHHGFEPRRGAWAYARSRRLAPTMTLAFLVLLLALWRAWLRPEPPPAAPPDRPPGPLGLVDPLAARLRDAGSLERCLGLLRTESRRWDKSDHRRSSDPEPSEEALLEVARDLTHTSTHPSPRVPHGSKLPPIARQ